MIFAPRPPRSLATLGMTWIIAWYRDDVLMREHVFAAEVFLE